MVKPDSMCEQCWVIWKDIIESALQNFNVFVGEYKNSDLKWLHCHHQKKGKKK